MSELHITRGLPASGKTTFAEAWVLEQPKTRARLNRDSFRRMIHVDAQNTTRHTEGMITKLAHDAARSMLRAGVDVIVDDTNLRQRTAREWATLAKVAGAELVVHDFTHVGVAECIRRNAGRVHRVPEHVIESMQRRYLAGKTLPLPHPEPLDSAAGDTGWVPYEHTEGLPWVVIVDIDGTVAQCGDRDIYDGSKAHLDTLHSDVWDAVLGTAEYSGSEIVFMTGRSEEHRHVTEAWLTEHTGLVGAPLHMRPAGDKRRDDAVKHELFNKHLRGRYNIAAAFDDRNQVVDLWRAMGIRTYQVAPGNF